ncbi:MAG: Rne/Rng family ribonuclease [Acidimicrobiia bacterium]|nr:Rne/Rng family ribonuclease [Acidimicrobiia bacterium]
MGLFRRKAAPKTIRRYVTAEAAAPAPAKESSPKRRNQQSKRSGGSQGAKARSGAQRRDRAQRDRGQQARQRRTRPHLEVVPPPDTARKQMLVRSMPHQTQIVVLEGPVLVEHYVARSDKKSLVGNVYVGKVRNVLPGMEAAFVDFGEGKNGVLYAGDVNYDDTELEGKRRRIEMVLKAGDPVLVQVVKDAMGHKGARLTNQISLAGRYLVLSPDPEVRGISRRLPEDERKRLRDIIAEVRPKGMGVIVRTAAEGASKEDVAADISRLRKIWERIDAKRTTPGPALIYEEPPLVLRVIREHFTRDFRRLMIDNRETYDRVLEYLEGTEADLTNKVKLYEDELPLFERFHVEDQLRKALDRKVWLPSGGHIVVDRTEALTVIDVNTGRFVGHSNLEETVLQNNLEAAEEIARQLRLRDIGGIIVIDFIDMEVIKNQDAVLQKFREQLAKDKMRTQVFEVSNLGLVEMTRKNVSAGLLESFSEVCQTCNGRGVLLHEDAATSGAPLPGLEEEE